MPPLISHKIQICIKVDLKKKVCINQQANTHYRQDYVKYISPNIIEVDNTLETAVYLVFHSIFFQ